MGTNVCSPDNTRSDPITCAIVIPIWGPPELTDKCLEYLERNTSDYQLILVDNTGQYNVKTSKNLHAVFRNSENQGFAKGCNQGARSATTDVVVFLNCDTEPQFDWLAELMAAFDDPAVMLVGPKLVYPDGRIQCAGIRVWAGPGGAGGENRQDDHATEDVEGLTGACVAIRRDAFAQLEGFDEDFWCGYEDVDLCLKAQAANMRMRYVASSLVMHHESATGPERWTKAVQNTQLLNDKWAH